jgi:uncharacterized membrane protein YbhN (UPF0104 family)
MTSRAGWGTRIFGGLLALAAGWFLVVHGGDLLPAIGNVVAMGPHVLPLALVLVVLGIVNRGLQARASFRLVELPAALPTMTSLSAASYATNKVVKSAGTAGLVPFFAHADRAGHCRARVVAAYVSTKLAETVSLVTLIAVAVAYSAATGGLHGTALFGAIASAGYALVVGIGVVLLASSRSLVEWVARVGRAVADRCRRMSGRPSATPMSDGPSAAGELSDALGRLRRDPRAASPLVGTAIAGKLLGFIGLLLVLSGLGIHLGIATALLVYTLTLMAALVGPLPGGIGVADASLGALLVANGVSAPMAAAAVVAFRLLDLWLPLLAGGAAWGATIRRHRRFDAQTASADEVAPADQDLPGLVPQPAFAV